MTESIENPSLFTEDQLPKKAVRSRSKGTGAGNGKSADAKPAKPAKVANTAGSTRKTRASGTAKSGVPAVKKAAGPSRKRKTAAAATEAPASPAATADSSISQLPALENEAPSTAPSATPAEPPPVAAAPAAPPPAIPAAPAGELPFQEPKADRPAEKPEQTWRPRHSAPQPRGDLRASPASYGPEIRDFPTREERIAAARKEFAIQPQPPHELAVQNRQPQSQEVSLPPRPPLQVQDVPRTEPVFAEGIVEVSGKGFGFLRDPKRSYAQHPSDIFVTPEVCRRYALRDGMSIRGEIRRGNGSQMYKLTAIEGEDPEKHRDLPMFEELTTVNPNKFIKLETMPERFTTRVVDMMAPIGKGQRGIIVAAPRTGKTTFLQHMADAIGANHPDIKLIVLLVDERPEEVTEFRRTIPHGEIMASSNDQDIKSHTRIAQLAIERAKRLVEMGKDVFVLLDSITRVGRAFNNSMAGGGRTMSGGVDARALEIPRKLFAAARNTEEAGSLTIIATALVETGSKMDELIFQEFKGTGNMELVLDRKISDLRIYPAVDIFQSGTRREELLLPERDLYKISIIRRGLAGHKPAEAIERLLSFMEKFPTNAQLLREIPG